MKDYFRWSKFNILTEIDKDVSIDDKVHKLGEEYGEFLQALLKYKGANNVSASAGDKEQSRENCLEELMDINNVLQDIIYAFGFTQEEIVKMSEKKLNKWGNKAKKYCVDEDLIDRLKNIEKYDQMWIDSKQIT